MSEPCGAMNPALLCRDSVWQGGDRQDRQQDSTRTSHPPATSECPSLAQSLPAPGFPHFPCSPIPVPAAPCSEGPVPCPLLHPLVPLSPVTLTAPGVAPLVPADEGVAKTRQDQQSQPDAQNNPDHLDGLLSWKAEGREALQTPLGGWGSRMSPAGDRTPGSWGITLLGVLSPRWGGTAPIRAGLCTDFCCPQSPVPEPRAVPR